MIVVVGQQDLDLKVFKILVSLLVFLTEQFKKFRIIVPVEFIEFLKQRSDVLFVLLILGAQIL